MQLISTLSLLLLQLSAQAAASPHLLETRQSAPLCDATFVYPKLGPCPSGCCGWGFYGQNESSGWLCEGTGTYAPPPPPAAANRSSQDHPHPHPAGWAEQCAALRDAVAADYFTWWLTSYQPATWYEARSNAGCSLQINFDRAVDPDGDGPHLGNGDLATMLTQAVDATQGGALDAAGYSTCYSYSLQWRMVPK